MSDKHIKCKGCRSRVPMSYERGLYYCNILEIHAEEDCPCQRCLIKVMCQQSCPEFDAYASVEGRVDQFYSSSKGVKP